MKCLVGELPVHYEIRGVGRPLLMIHGFGPDHRLMLGCMEPLFERRDGWRRIYFDLPGMGETPAPEWLTFSDQMLEVVRGFVDQVLRLEHYCVAGQSYGGYLAQGLAARDSARMEGMLLLCPLAIADPSRRNVPKHVVLEREPGLLERLAPEERTEFESIAVVESSNTWEKMKRDILPGLSAGDKVFMDRIWSTGYGFSREADLRRRVYGKPVLILTGRQDSVVGYADAWDLLPRYPRAAYAVLDRAGHSLQVEQPELFSALVLEWLERVEKAWP